MPADCERIVIVGAGGFGREVLQWARHAWPEHSGKIAGFLSADPHKLDGYSTGLPILGSPDDFAPERLDGFLMAIGIPRARRRVAESLEAKGARFLTLIHPTAIVADTAQIGTGTVVCPFAVISAGAHVGRSVVLNYYASLGHDALVGDFSILSPYATLGGHARIAEDVFLALHASVGPGSSVGARSKLSANASLLAKAPSDSIIFGSPGTVAPRISIASP